MIADVRAKVRTVQRQGGERSLENTRDNVMICQLLLVAVVALIFVTVPLEGASVRPVQSPEASTTTTDNVADTVTENVTASDNEDVLAKFLSTTQVDAKQQTHTRVRRWTIGTNMDIGTLQAHSENLNVRSKCPWTYTYNTDSNRQPQTLVEAQCTQLYVPGLAGQCEHVYYYVPVKRNVSGVWTDQWIWIRVGCTLATPISGPPITFN